MNACLFAGLVVGLLADPTPPKPESHTEVTVEGWKLRVDDRLRHGADKALGDRVLRLVESRLADIRLVLPAERVLRLQKVVIVLDRTHGKLTSAQYHPSVEWLERNGYDAQLAKCVHVPDCMEFAGLNHQQVQPWSLLHELAHAYHDQVLGFDDPEIVSAYRRFKASGRYESVLHINGRRTRHYALSDPKEFFAELTESYFGTNDFYPFNKAELREAEPEIYRLMERSWKPHR